MYWCKISYGINFNCPPYVWTVFYHPCLQCMWTLFYCTIIILIKRYRKLLFSVRARVNKTGCRDASHGRLKTWSQSQWHKIITVTLLFEGSSKMNWAVTTLLQLSLSQHQPDWLLTCCCFCWQGHWGHLCTNKWASPSTLCKQYEPVYLAAQGEDNLGWLAAHAGLHSADLQSSFCCHNVKSKGSHRHMSSPEKHELQ